MVREGFPEEGTPKLRPQQPVKNKEPSRIQGFLFGAQAGGYGGRKEGDTSGDGGVAVSAGGSRAGRQQEGLH